MERVQSRNEVQHKESDVYGDGEGVKSCITMAEAAVSLKNASGFKNKYKL